MSKSQSMSEDDFVLQVDDMKGLRFTPMQVLVLTSICMTAFALDILGHELLGHGVMGCLGAGFQVRWVTSADLECSPAFNHTDPSSETSPFGWVAAAGTFYNLLAGSLALGALILYKTSTPMEKWSVHSYLFGMYFVVYNFNEATGYLMVSPLAYAMDWQAALKDVQPNLTIRIVVTLFGLAGQIGNMVLFWYLMQPVVGKYPVYKFQRSLCVCYVPLGTALLAAVVQCLVMGPRVAVFAIAGAFGGNFLFAATGFSMIGMRKKEGGRFSVHPPLHVGSSPVWLYLGAIFFVLYSIVFAVGFGPFGVGVSWGKTY